MTRSGSFTESTPRAETVFTPAPNDQSKTDAPLFLTQEPGRRTAAPNRIGRHESMTDYARTHDKSVGGATCKAASPACKDRRPPSARRTTESPAGGRIAHPPCTRLRMMRCARVCRPFVADAGSEAGRYPRAPAVQACKPASETRPARRRVA